jgi:hypothetical protein
MGALCYDCTDYAGMPAQLNDLRRDEDTDPIWAFCSGMGCGWAWWEWSGKALSVPVPGRGPTGVKLPPPAPPPIQNFYRAYGTFDQGLIAVKWVEARVKPDTFYPDPEIHDGVTLVELKIYGDDQADATLIVYGVDRERVRVRWQGLLDWFRPDIVWRELP